MRTKEASFPRALIFGTENTFRFFLANTRAKGEIVFSSSSEISIFVLFSESGDPAGEGRTRFPRALEHVFSCFAFREEATERGWGGGGSAFFSELLTLGIENVFPCFSLVGKAPLTGIKRTRTRDNLEVF